MSFLKRLVQGKSGETARPETASPSSGKHLLDNLNVLITGAARNIGRAAALEMAGEGARIFFTDIDEQGIKTLEQELKERGAEAQGFLSNVSSPEDIDNLVAFFAKEEIPIQILVNNAAITKGHGDVRNMQPVQWRALFDTNLIGPMYLTSRVAGMMVDLRIAGSIIFLTSLHDHIISRWPDYSSSKAAVSMLVKELAVDLASHGIRVNAIAPGFVWKNPDGEPPPHPYTLLGRRAVDPKYIGRTAVYLASDYFSRYTTGSILVVDGGLSLVNHRVVEEPPR